MSTLKFFITERHNPQLKKSYFNARGQKTKKEINQILTNCRYGSYSIYGIYNNIEEYNLAISQLEKSGNTVYKY